MSQKIAPVLEKMLASCKAFQTLLRDDQDYLKQNDLKNMATSNLKKNTQLAQLQSLVSQIGSLNFESFSHEHADIINALHAEIANCYQYIMTNGQVIFANLKQINMIKDVLVAENTAATGVYDMKGCVK